MSPSFLMSSELNNKGCILIENGRYDEAIACLKEALQVAKRQNCEESPSQNDCIGSGTGQVVNRSSPHQMVNSSTGGLERSTRNGFEFSIDPESPFVSRETLPIADLPPMDRQTALAFVSFTILFNLALAHHLWALEDCVEANARRKYGTAKQLYEYTFQIQSELVQTNIFTTVAMLNNLAQVHKVLKNEYEASQCEKLLLSAVLLVIDINEPRTQERLDGYLNNVMHLMVTDSVTAGAA